MIASFPSLPADAPELLEPKAPGALQPIALKKGAAPAVLPDFASWVAKALAGPPVTAARGKDGKEKSETKPAAVDKEDKNSIPSAPNDALLAVAEPPPPLPPLPLPKLGSHSAPSPHASTTAVTPDRGERTTPRSALAANGKLADPPPVAIKPPLPELAAKPTAEHAAKLGAGTDGMTVAPNGDRMKFVAEQNKTAGQATQKLPPVAPISSAAAVKADAPGAKVRLPVDFSAKDNASEQVLLTAAKAASPSAPGAVMASSAVPAPSAAERIEKLVTREAVSFKQSGADEVGVSLKIDAHTQLFLQLSYRDGQTQAVLRCEKGDLPALSAHFGQLQESLARQNIQLQSSGHGSDLGQQRPPGRSWQESSPVEDSSAKNAAKSASSTKPKTKPLSRQGWESWA
jgi:hypothetical protein